MLCVVYTFDTKVKNFELFNWICLYIWLYLHKFPFYKFDDVVITWAFSYVWISLNQFTSPEILLKMSFEYIIRILKAFSTLTTIFFKNDINTSYKQNQTNSIDKNESHKMTTARTYTKQSIYNSNTMISNKWLNNTTFGETAPVGSEYAPSVISNGASPKIKYSKWVQRTNARNWPPCNQK